MYCFFVAIVNSFDSIAVETEILLVVSRVASHAIHRFFSSLK